MLSDHFWGVNSYFVLISSTKIASMILGKTPPKAMEWGWAPLVHCCTPSLCWLEAETGYRVGTPYMRQWNVWATAKAKFDGFCSIFLQKAHVTSISSVDFFWGSPKIIFTPSNGPFFRGTGTFPELRGPSQNWGAGLWEDPRGLLLRLLIIPAHN